MYLSDKPDEYHNEVGKHLEQVGHEIGTSTGIIYRCIYIYICKHTCREDAAMRVARCAWLDAVYQTGFSKRALSLSR